MIGNNSGNKKYINVKYVSTVGPTEEKPYFAILGEDYKETDKATTIGGTLTDLKGSFTPAKGKMGDIYGFKAYFNDGEEVVVLESTITNASKDMLNVILLSKGLNLKVDAKLNKNKYPTAYVTDVDSGDWLKDGAFSIDDKASQKMLFDEIGKQFPAEIKTSDLPF